MTTDWQTSPATSLVLPELVGRQKILTEVLSRVQNRDSNKSCVFFLYGEGGLGKTRLLEELLSRCKLLSGVKASNQVVDAYHLSIHTEIGLTHSIVMSLTPPHLPFRDYSEAYREGGTSRDTNQQRKIVQSFMAGLRSLTKHERVVIAIDTAERFLYDSPSMPRELTQVADAWQWFSNILGEIENVILLLAGRPPAEEILSSIPEKVDIVRVPFEPFKLKESLDYFVAISKTLRDKGAKKLADRLESLAREEQKQVHILAKGRPILLTLVAQYVISGGSIAPLFHSMDKKGDTTDQERFEGELLARLITLPVLGDTLRALGLAPKGVDAELLSTMLPAISYQEANKLLEEVCKYSFAKVHGERVFLHDELYILLRKHVYSTPSSMPEKELMYSNILDYYETKLNQIRDELNKLYMPLEEQGKREVDAIRLADLHERHRELLCEVLYYRLRDNATMGYRRWYRYARQAILYGDVLLDIQLQLELLAFVGEHNPEGKLTQIDNLDLGLIEWAMAMRPVTRAWAMRKYEDAITAAQKVRKIYIKEIEADPTKKGCIIAWEAYSYAMSSSQHSLISVEKDLDDVIILLENFLKSSIDDNCIWHAQAVLAFTYRVRGYQRRVKGHVEEAITDYGRAAVFLRSIDLKIEMATTLNDMGFAMTEQGQWTDARSLVLNALTLRRNLGPRLPVAMSINTLAMLDIYEGDYPDARANAEKAFLLFDMFGDKRGVGLAKTALAEASRRYSGTLSDVEERARLLRQARKDSQQALANFLDVNEVSRQVEAWIETGCACRDLVKLVKDQPFLGEDLQQLSYESEEAFRQAAELAEKEGILYRQVDALVDLAWLYYYKEQDKLAEDTIQEAESKIPPEYFLEPSKGGRPPIYGAPSANLLLLNQLGKMNVLRGHILFDRHFQKFKERIDSKETVDKESEKIYTELAEAYLLLEYSSLYSPDSRGLRLAKQGIYERLRILPGKNMELLVRCLTIIEKKYNIPYSHFRQFLCKRALWQD